MFTVTSLDVACLAPTKNIAKHGAIKAMKLNLKKQ
jgi:hypothetical protein